MGEAIDRFSSAGFIPIVVTNQPEISRGNIQVEDVQAMHDYLSKELGLTHFFVCMHDDSDNCVCRKPKSGLLLQAAIKHDIDLTKSKMIGDRWKDIVCGQHVGCECFFIDYNYEEAKPPQPYTSVTSLLDASYCIIQK